MKMDSIVNNAELKLKITSSISGVFKETSIKQWNKHNENSIMSG